MEPYVLMIAMSTVEEDPGGGNRYADELARVLSGSGTRCRRLLLAGSTPDSADVTAVARREDPMPLRLLRYARIARRYAQDAQVLNTHFALYGAAARLSRRARRLQLVVNFQGPWARESAAAGSRSRLVLRLKHAIEAHHYRQADHLIVLSGAFRDLLCADYGVAPNRVHVVAPGVDLERFCPADQEQARDHLGMARDAHVTVSVRRLTPRMGLDRLVRAWVDLPARAHLYLAGTGPEQGNLQALVASLGLRDRVHLLGRVEDTDLPDLYRAADLSVVPSLELEGFGLTVLEALACGTPVIASDTGGMAEILPDLAGDLLVSPGDIRALARRLTRAVEDPAAEPSREQCRAFAERFSWQRQGARVRDVLGQAAATERT